MMQFGKSSSRRHAFWLAAVLSLGVCAPAVGQDKSVTIAQKTPAQTQAGPQAPVLTLEESIRLALENQPRIKGAQDRVKIQQAVLGVALGAYYPTLRVGQSYGTAGSAGNVTQQAGTARLIFDYTLYNFGKREGAVQTERDNLQATQFNGTATTNDVVLGVKQAYYLDLAADALVRVREEAVKTRELLVNQARGFFEVGVRPKIDVARAEANLYTEQANLITAQNAAQIGLANLKNAIGVDALPGRPMLPSGKIPFTEPTLTLEEARQTAFATRPELKSFQAQRKAQDQVIAVARRNYLPDIVFGADAGRGGSKATSSSFQWQGFWDVGVSVNFSIFDGLRTSYRVQQAMENYYLILAQEETTKQAIDLEVETSYLRVKAALGTIKANDAALVAAKENLDLANGRYQVGVGTIIESTDAQSTYTDAQTRYIQSIYDYKVAEAQLIRAIGQQ